MKFLIQYLFCKKKVLKSCTFTTNSCTFTNTDVLSVSPVHKCTSPYHTSVDKCATFKFFLCKTDI